MVTLPKPESIPTSTKHKISRARNHDNSVAVAYVKELQAAGVADWATQTCNDFGISRATLYRMIKIGRLRVVKIGSRSVIPASCLLALLDEPVEVAQ
jgi:excisionase family DNA binding protein